jgi:ABC-type branched-subunit amino acid transport system substrate-binding protein
MSFEARLGIIAIAVALLSASAVAAQEKKYGPGASDTEIKIGQTMPYSGPVSAFGQAGITEAAYFKMINEKGGIRGRKINFITVDDGYQPPKTLEGTRKLVEEDQVLFMLHTMGTPASLAIRKYLNAKAVPDIFVSVNSQEFNKPKEYPLFVPFYPFSDTETAEYADYISKNRPDAEIAVLYQNDDFGKYLLQSLKKFLGPKAKDIVREASYETSDPTVTSQMIGLKGSGADTLIVFATPKFTAQAIRGAADMEWRPLVFITSVSTSVSQVLRTAGLDKSKGIVSTGIFKMADDETWTGDKGMQDYLAFLKQWRPESDPSDLSTLVGYTVATGLVQILQECGDDLTRDNVMRQMIAWRPDLQMLLPGIEVAYTADDYNAFHKERLQRFDGKSWRLLDDSTEARKP